MKKTMVVLTSLVLAGTLSACSSVPPESCLSALNKADQMMMLTSQTLNAIVDNDDEQYKRSSDATIKAIQDYKQLRDQCRSA